MKTSKGNYIFGVEVLIQLFDALRRESIDFLVLHLYRFPAIAYSWMLL